MNKKEILMICLIICFIFSLQAVSAADVELNTTDDTIMAVQSDDTVSISNDLSSYSLPEDNSIVRGENDGAGSFSELQEKIDNDNTGTISLDKNYTYNSSSDSGLTNGIVISKNINIIGNDFTIDALSSARIFNIETGSTVTLTGINFVNGGSASVDYGGSIHSDAQDLTIDDCTFKGSYASEDGGALFISGNGCKLSDSTFIDNTAGDDGGAICWNGDDGTIYNITCNNNTGICHGDSSSRGGAISLTGDNVNISKSTFTSNHVIYSDGSDISKIDGGAIFATGHDVTITDSTFTDCTASNMGGAIYTLGDNNIIKNTTFTNNKASEDGGALYVLGNGTKLYDSTFTDNVAGDDGGAICWNGDDGTIYNITCNNNTGICNDDSNSRGGTISLTGNNVNISKSSITSGRVVYSDGSDSSKIDGGAMFITGDNIIISDTNFTDCTASNDGGAIYALGNNVEIINSIFTNNEVTEDGGALYISGENCKIYNSTLNDNRAGDDGGAIYWEGANGIIDGCDFTDNKGLSAGNPSDPSTSKGGTLSVTGDKLSILNSNFTRSITYNRDNSNVGGAIFITGDDVDIESCNFDECTASDADGGTIYIIGDRTTITNSNISDSTARAGGAIYIDGVYASVIDSSFTNTFAKTGAVYGTDNLGGAIYIKGNHAKISGSDFDESAAYSGGIIYLEGNYCNVSDSSFNGGSASNDGGAMYSTGSYSTVTNSNFTYNGAQGNGGAMYWYGGSNSKYNDILGCLFEENVAYARSSSNTKGGGAIYWSEGGAHDSIKDSKFIRNSVQSDNKADGGAILWDRSNYVVIDNCIFDGDYITTSATGNVWVQGGALYLRVDSKAVINNSVFVNCSSDKEAGALYVQSKSNLDINNPILIENTKFISNVAKAIAPNVYGGGAVQVKECNNIFFTNDSFINNTANNGGALSVYNAAEPVKFIDCVFIGNNATQNGGSIWFNKRLYLYNVTISDSYAENFGGGMYNENAELIHNNLTFINNTALNGGGIYWNRNNINIHDMVFLNNTALQYGGAIYISKGGNSLSNVNMTGNKAFSGSAIYSTAAFTLTNAYLIENQANSSSLTFDSYDESTGKIVLLFKGKDKYLNAIYVTGSNRPTCNNVTYWSENGVDNTGSSAVTLPNAADPTPEAGQNITVGVYDDKGNLLNPDNQYFITDKNGKIYLDFHDIVPGVPSEQYGEIYVEAILTNDDYYTIIKLTSRAPSSINASATNTTYHSNSTLSVNVTHGATGNVSVYLNDTFLGNITLDDSKGSINISTLIEGSYLPAGNHTLSFVYGGNAKYDKSNTTAILEISKITPTLLVNVTGIGYNLVVNVTVMDGRYNISDATGNVTIEVAGRTTTIYLANGQGMTVIYGLPIGNYTVNATYNGDNNYYSTSNSTYGNVTEKTQTVLLLEVDNDRTYFINETVPIKVTILPNAEGNITLYINGEPHVLALQTVDNSTFVEFNATDLKDGINHVFATYEGTGLYAPSWAQDTFNVTKFNATVEIKTENITLGDTEVINITVPEDATGILNVTVNGTPYYIEIINGNATLPISGLSVGVYNVTVTFVGDKKYYNATNSTLFNVSKATPSINVTVENITYGEDAIVIVTVPEGQSGNVTIKLNETVVFTQEPIDGQATFTLKNLSASNYTIEATFNGNENYTIASNSTNFTVFKATPELNVTVEDIYYGDAEHIIIKVNTGGNVTVKVNGTETILNITSSGNETYVYDLAVGNYPVEVTFNGNENYTEVTVTKDFNVYQVNTTLDVDVHDIVVWDKESINVTLAKNATGNVIININGVNHTVPIANGTAQLNLTNLTVGHKVVWVFYDGDRNYTANRTMAEFDVGQRTPKVNVTALNITVDQDGKITINIPANATGFVILSGNFTKHPIYVDEFTNGVAEITVDDLAVGKYSVHIKYYGDALDNYTVAENDTTFTVGKINATVTIDADNVTYGNDTTIVVTVPDGVTGNITLKLNDTAGRSITLPIVDGKVTWIVDGLAAGNYTVNATYNGNDDYNINDTESAKFEVKKADPDMNFIVSGTVHDNATVLIFINDEIHGKVVNVTVDGVLYPNVSVDDEFITHVLTEYKPYTIIVEYGGNENFTDARVEHTFTPSKVTTYGINITAMNITVGDDEIITVEVPDNVDDVVIWVNGTKYRNTSFSDNKATFNVTGLKEGIYTVTATVNDTEFVPINFTTIFTVSKTYPSINITVVNETSIYVNDTVKVIVTVPSDATEDVTIEINGMKFTNSTVNGNATFYIPQITFGNKTVVATYPGDDKYRFNSTTANFTVNKRQSQVNVTVDAGLVGDDTVINVTIPANATGYVIVNVDGTNYTVNTTNGNGSITIKGLGNTTHTVHVTYIGDDQYLPSENETTFGIPKDNTTIAISVESINYGEKANITVTVKDDATGYITIKINDTQEITLPVVNGTVNWIVDGLAAGNYTVYANYSGDDKYNKNATEKEFEVRQISPEIKIIRVISTAGENATIIIEIDPRTTENITVHVDKDYSVKPVNGIAVVTTDVLDYGNYTVNASYVGDKNFTKDYDIYEFITNQTDVYLINITASDINVGENTNITVNVPADATGKVIIELNGTNYTATIDGGKAVLDNISTLKEGVYNVTAYFGDAKYENKTVSTRFAVSKVDTPITITIVNETNIYVNDTVKVIVTVPSDVTEDVTIEINGMKFTNSTVNGNATFYIPQITFGNKTVVATYPGDDKYRFNSTTANFTVNKRQSQVNVTVDAGLVGDDTVINVTIPANATGYVIVNVDGTNYTVNTTNGNGSITIKGLGNTTHTVHVTYIGDDQYLPSENETTFGIPKDNTTIAISVESINYGEKANITVTVKDDATGYITIKINDTQEITLPVVNGTVNWIVDGLAAGNYTVYANYSGDGKYNVNATDKDFEVRQISPDIEIIAVISTADENATIIVKVDPRVSDNITVNVNNKNYRVKPVDGIAVVTTDVLDYGNYTVNASYAGDKNFTKDYDTYEFITNQTDDYLINITASDINVGENTNITVNVPADATGKVIIELNGTNYTATINGGKAVLNNVSTLKEGVYNVTAYFGDDKYVNKTVETRFAVSKVDIPIAITVVNDTSILVGDTVKVIVTVPNDVTENVTIEINGMEFTNSTVDGNATFYIPEITFGNKTVVATYPGDDKYRFNSTTANFTVNKRELDMQVDVTEVISVGDVAQVNVTLPENATGYVVVKVDGQNYTINLTDGKGSVEIKGLLNGTYPVEVTYLGDDQYLSRSNNTQEIKVNKVPSFINITVSEDGIIANGSDVDIFIKAPIDVTGKVNVTIFDVEKNINTTYVVYVNEGEGKLHLETPLIGVYKVNAKYLENDKYLESENYTTFEVYDNEEELAVISTNVYVNETNIVTVMLNGNHTGDNLTVIITNASGEVIRNESVLITDYVALFNISSAQLKLPLLDAGHYEIKAVYTEVDGAKTIVHEGNNSFDVWKLSSEIKIKEIKNITVGENATIELEIELDSRADDGNISVFVDGKEYVTNTSTLKVNVPYLGAGNYTVEAFYHGNRWYNESNATSAFKVDKNDVPIIINVTNSNVGEVEQINVTVGNNATGYVIVDVDGQQYHVNITDGVAQVNITGLKAGEHNVTAIYVENDKFLGNSTNTTLTISKVPSTVNVTVDNITVGDVAAVNITVITNGTGNVTIVIGDEYNKTVGVTDGVISVIVPGLTVGDKTVNVTYNGDDRFLPSENSANFTVGKTTTDIVLVVQNITYGDVETIVAFINATGNVTIKVDGVVKGTSNIVGGKVTYDIPGLNAGNHTVEVIYNGDADTNSTSAKADFTVFKADVELEISVQDIPYGDVEHIIVTVKAKGNAEGNVTITVAGNITTIVLGEEETWILKAGPADGNGDYTGEAKWNIYNLAVGTYPVTATYNGNENFNALTKDASFIVYQINTTLDVEVHDILVWDKESINITLAKNTTGNVIININGEDHTVPITNGTAQLNLTNLTVGHKFVWVFYDGDKNYTANRTMVEFDVGQRNPKVNVTALNVTVGQDGKITINIPANATGYVVLSGNFTENPIHVDEFTDGVAEINVSGLTNGTYSVHIKYYGDALDNYTTAENDTTFTVSKSNTPIAIAVESIDYGEKANITVTVEDDATGYITIKINDTQEITLPVVNGTVNWIVDNLPADNYTVYANYSGDDKYNKNGTDKDFEVRQISPEIQIIAVVSTADENATIIVKVDPRVSDNITVNVNNKNYRVKPVDGIAVVTTDVLDYGNYTVNASYAGDKNFTQDDAIYKFTTNQTDDYLINITASDIEVGDNTNITVNVPSDATGKVIIELNGTNYTCDINNGKAVLNNISTLKEGVYNVTAYFGDDKYMNKTVQTRFVVSKVDTPITITVVNDTNILVDDTVKIIVTVPEDVTENVTIEINGMKFTNSTVDGNATFYVPNITYGNKTVVATYTGDDKYRFNSTTANFTVSKVTPEIKLNVTVNGDKATVVVEVPEDVTKPVLVDIDGVGCYVNITNGKGQFVLTNLTGGSHNVDARYPGDDKYTESDVVSETFDIENLPSTVSVKVDNITYGDDAVVEVTVPSDATGTVTVTIEGKSYEANVSGGKAVVIVPGLDAGNYTVDVTYNGDDKYNSSSNSTELEVSKAPTDIKVVDQGNGTVVVVVSDNATGTVTVKVGNNTYNATVENGVAVINLENETPGTHDIEVIYSGDKNHLGANTTSNATIPKLETPINVTVENIKVGDKETIVVTVPENATGNVTIEINGVKYTEEIKDGKATFEIENLTAGNKTVAVDYPGDDNYLGNHTTANFTVSKVTPEIKMNVTLDDDVVIIDVEVPKDVTKPVLVDVDGVGFYVNITDGKGQLVLSNLTGGSHNVDAKYLGDDKYTESDVVSETFDIENLPSTVSVKVDNITYGDDAVVEVTVPSDATGTVTVTIEGKSYEANVSGGKAVVIVPGLDAGNYTVDVTYNGDDKYNSSSNSTELEVSKAPTDIKVVDQGNGTVVVVVSDNATGTVTVKVGNNTYNATVENGVAVINLENETPGTHDIEVIYSGDKNHLGANTTSNATIPKITTPISVDVDDCKVGDTAVVIVTVPENATGNVTIEVDGVKYTSEIKDGKAVFNVTNLTDGNKTVAVDYPGDDTYLGNHTTANFTVDKCPSTVEAQADPIDAGETAVITVTVPEDATGYVIVEIDNQTYAGKIVDGTATVEVKGLAGGDYPINVTYPGDDKYAPSNYSTNLKVSKVPSTVNVTVDDITVGDKAVINVETPEDVCGNVTVSVDGQNYTVFVSGGKGTLVVPDLDVGPHTVDVIFEGCKKYEPSNNTAQFNVNKINTTGSDIKVVDQGNGTVVVVVPDNANGTVEIKVGNNTYNATVENGVATITLDNETPGTHDIEVTYSGDDTHEGASTNATATIPKITTPISVDVDDCKVGDTAVVTVNVPEDATGNVTIEVDGVKYTSEIKDGKAVFEVPALTDGTKTIAVDYPGDDTYLGNHTTGNFTVSKRESQVSATIDDSNVGDSVTVTVTVPKDATGQVLVDIDGVGYYVNVTNGTGTVEIPRIPSGVYNVSITYPGDDKYLPSSNNTTFKVNKVESFVIPKAEDIYVGDNEVITISVPEDATGNVTIVIDGKEYNFNLDDGKLSGSEDDGVFTVAVSGGKGKLVISGLPKGDYVVSARYNGDDKYLPSTNSTTFKVLRKSSTMDVTDLGNGTVVVDLPDNATGTVSIKVGNNTYNATVKDGKAVVDLTNETPGVHDIEVTYSGDDTHEPQVEDSKVTIPKHNTPISVDVDDCYVGDTAVVTVTLPDDATGNVTIEINGKSYTTEVKDGKAVFNVTGLAAGNKTVAVKYDGDKNYVENSTTGQFTVSKRPSTVSATGKDINVGKDEVITVTVPKDATGRVLIDIDGVGYYGTIVNGKAKVVIPELPSGKYTAKVTYEGDDKYLPSTTTTKFTVTKVKTPIKATGDEINQGDDATVVVRVPSDATGTVTITVDGKKYTTEVKDGKAVFTIPGLTKGDHEVTASYSGDKKYEANDTITDIEVNYNESPDSPEHGGSEGGADLTQHATGNPILVLLLIILAAGSTQIRRFRK